MFPHAKLLRGTREMHPSGAQLPAATVTRPQNDENSNNNGEGMFRDFLKADLSPSYKIFQYCHLAHRTGGRFNVLTPSLPRVSSLTSKIVWH